MDVRIAVLVLVLVLRTAVLVFVVAAAVLVLSWNHVLNQFRYTFHVFCRTNITGRSMYQMADNRLNEAMD